MCVCVCVEARESFSRARASGAKIINCNDVSLLSALAQGGPAVARNFPPARNARKNDAALFRRDGAMIDSAGDVGSDEPIAERVFISGVFTPLFPPVSFRFPTVNPQARDLAHYPTLCENKGRTRQPRLALPPTCLSSFYPFRPFLLLSQRGNYQEDIQNIPRDDTRCMKTVAPTRFSAIVISMSIWLPVGHQSSVISWSTINYRIRPAGRRKVNLHAGENHHDPETSSQSLTAYQQK